MVLCLIVPMDQAIGRSDIPMETPPKLAHWHDREIHRYVESGAGLSITEGESKHNIRTVRVQFFQHRALLSVVLNLTHGKMRELQISASCLRRSVLCTNQTRWRRQFVAHVFQCGVTGPLLSTAALTTTITSHHLHSRHEEGIVNIESLCLRCISRS